MNILHIVKSKKIKEQKLKAAQLVMASKKQMS